MSLKRAIEKTINYLSGYGRGFGVEEVKERLISRKIYGDEEIESQLSVADYRLPVREQKKNKKLKKAKELVKKYLSGLGDILMVGVTGSVAAGQPKEDDDIDLMIITRKDRLWITRLRLRWLIWRQGIPHRKYGQKEHGDEFCFNLWIDDGTLGLPAIKRTLQSAMDLILMQPILNREGRYEMFVMANSWATKYVATGYSKLKVHQVCKIYKEKRSCFWLVANWMTFVGQYIFMRPKMKGELVSLRWAFFHPVV